MSCSGIAGDVNAEGKPSAKDKHPPIRCLYLHLHESIRAELSQLNAAVHQIEKSLSTSDVTGRLLQLRDRYQLLVQVNRYHASVEDEVRRGPVALSRDEAYEGHANYTNENAHMMFHLQIVYPALEYKVQNVTQPYSVEHGEEVSYLPCHLSVKIIVDCHGWTGGLTFVCGLESGL